MYNYPMKTNTPRSQSTNLEVNKKALAEKKANGCEDCGWNLHPSGLDLDHVDPNSKYVTKSGRRPSPGTMLSYNPLVFALELAKCRVMCKNCHGVHTFFQQEAIRKAGENKTRGKNFIRSMSEVSDRLVAC
jgi:hypothetical protein